mgnify:CR=1 FL=1
MIITLLVLQMHTKFLQFAFYLINSLKNDVRKFLT